MRYSLLLFGFCLAFYQSQVHAFKPSRDLSQCEQLILNVGELINCKQNIVCWTDLLNREVLRKRISNAVFLVLNEIADRFKSLLRENKQKTPIEKLCSDFDDIFDEIRSYLQHQIVTLVLEISDEVKSYGVISLLQDSKPILPLVLNTMDILQRKCNFIFYIFPMAYESLFKGLPPQIAKYLKPTDLNVLRETENRELTFEEIDDARGYIQLVKADVGHAFFQERLKFKYTNKLKQAFHLTMGATHFSNILNMFSPAVTKDDLGSTEKKTGESTDETSEASSTGGESNMDTGIEANVDETIVPECDAKSIIGTNRAYSTEWLAFVEGMTQIINNNI